MFAIKNEKAKEFIEESNKNKISREFLNQCKNASQLFKKETSNVRDDGLTEQEGKVMDALVTAWNEYIKLEKQHPSEIDDFADGIHKCQHNLCMRILRRDYPIGYPTYNNK